MQRIGDNDLLDALLSDVITEELLPNAEVRLGEVAAKDEASGKVLPDKPHKSDTLWWIPKNCRVGVRQLRDDVLLFLGVGRRIRADVFIWQEEGLWRKLDNSSDELKEIIETIQVLNNFSDG